MSDIDFFISYTSPDKEWAEWIAWQLESEDYTCAIQAWDFKPGADFMEQMRSAMENTRQTIAVLSPDYMQSKFANAEMNAALTQDPLGKLAKLLPVMIVSFELPGMLSARVHIDLVGKDEEHARRELLEGVRASRATRVKPAESVRFPKPPQFPSAERLSEVQKFSTASIIPTIPCANRLRILFLAATAGLPLNLEKELRLIQSRVNNSKFSSSIDVHCKFDAAAEDFLPALNDVRPNLLHFSGNMAGNAILLQSKNGGVRPVGANALVGLLRTVKEDLRLVILNACYSLECATALAELVGCAIGVAKEINDEAAIVFASDFYGAIAVGRSVKNAFDQAIASLEFQGIEAGDAPQLVCRNGIDATELFLIHNENQDQ